MNALALQPWMSAPSTLAVMDALEAVGGPQSARFVGGCVRDALMRRPVSDIDIATRLEPQAVIKALKAAGLTALPTGLDHGVVTAIASGKSYEITSLRKDVATDGRRAVVAFTDDWAEDAERRDFRFNALYMDRQGRLYDPTGGGLEDAANRKVIFVGDPQTRIREDYLRILRFFRFLAWFGAAIPDPEALAACAALKDGIETLSGERIASELLKLLAAEDPRKAVSIMAASGVLGEVLPEAQGLARFKGLVGIETELLFTCDPVLRLASLIGDGEDAARRASRRLRLSGVQEHRLVTATSKEIRLVSWMSPREIRRAIYRLGKEVFQDQITLAWATSERPASYPQWRMLLVYAETWSPPPFPLSGAEIMAAGVPEGPLIGQIRREVLDWWIDLDFTDDKMAVLERLKAVVQGMAY